MLARGELGEQAVQHRAAERVAPRMIEDDEYVHGFSLQRCRISSATMPDAGVGHKFVVSNPRAYVASAGRTASCRSAAKRPAAMTPITSAPAASVASSPSADC